LFLLLTTSNAHADWQSGFSYDVAVGTSASGPFASSAIIWTSGAAPGFFPSAIDIWAEGAQPGGTKTTLAESYVFFEGDKGFSNFTHSPFFIKVSLHDKASGLSDSIVLGGSYDPSGQPNGGPVPSFFGHVKRKIGNHEYDVTASPPEFIALPSSNGPDDVVGFRFDAMILTTEVAPNPEPASLLLALPAALALGISAMRRRRSSGRLVLFLLPETEFSNE
jgi:hypothetical protein